LGLISSAVTSFESVLSHTADPVRRARVRGEIASALLHTSPSHAIAQTKAGLAELDSVADRPDVPAIRLRIQSFEAMSWFLAGRYAEVLRLGKGMVAVATSLDSPRALARAYGVLSWACLGSGRVALATVASERNLAAGERSGNKADIASAHVNLGMER